MTPGQGTRFIVLTTQRSGSTWLIDVLNRLEQVTVYGELFLTKPRRWDAGSLDYPRFCESSHARLHRRPFSVQTYLDELYAQPGPVGFKLMYSELRKFPEIWLYRSRHRVKIVHLIRRNYLNVLISKHRVLTTGQAHMVSDRVRVDEPKLRLDPRTALAQLQWQHRKIALMRTVVRCSGANSTEVFYEDLQQDFSEFNAVRNFLELDSGAPIPRSALHKITRSGHRDTIANYDEIKAALQSTRFADMIE